MQPTTRIGLIAVSCLTISCDQTRKSYSGDTRSAPVVSYSTPGAQWLEVEFTPWMSRAELQYLQETNPADQYFAHVEGRNNNGRIEYRAVTHPFDSTQYEQWAVFWGINETELFDWELRLLKAGFTRRNMQVFADSSGKAVHQIVWLKPLGGPDEQASALAEVPTDEATAAIIPPSLNAPEDAPQATSPPRATASEAESPAKIVPTVPIAESEAPTPADKSSRSSIYIVQPGDNLGKIAKRKGVTVAELKKTNQLKSDVLRIGQKLTITK